MSTQMQVYPFWMSPNVDALWTPDSHTLIMPIEHGILIWHEVGRTTRPQHVYTGRMAKMLGFSPDYRSFYTLEAPTYASPLPSPTIYQRNTQNGVVQSAIHFPDDLSIGAPIGFVPKERTLIHYHHDTFKLECYSFDTSQILWSEKVVWGRIAVQGKSSLIAYSGFVTDDVYARNNNRCDISVVNTLTSELMQVFSEHIFDLKHVQFIDQTTVMSCDITDVVWVWNALTGEAIDVFAPKNHAYARYQGAIRLLNIPEWGDVAHVFSADKRWMLVYWFDDEGSGNIALRHLASSSVYHLVYTLSTWHTAATISPNGAFVVFYDEQKHLRVWSLFDDRAPEEAFILSL